MTPTDWLLIVQTAAIGVAGLGFLFRGEARTKVLEAQLTAHITGDCKALAELKADIKEIRADVRRIHEKLGGR